MTSHGKCQEKIISNSRNQSLSGIDVICLWPTREVVHVRLKDVESLPMAATAFFLALKIKTMSHLWRGPSSAFWRSSLSTGTARLYPPMTSWIYRHRPLFVPSICPHRSNLELDNHSLLSYKDHTCMRLYSQQLIMQNATMALRYFGHEHACTDTNQTTTEQINYKLKKNTCDAPPSRKQKQNEPHWEN